jgi:hypothetical protein
MSSGAIRLIQDMDLIGEGTWISEVYEAHDQRPCFMVSGLQFFVRRTSQSSLQISMRGEFLVILLKVNLLFWKFVGTRLSNVSNTLNLMAVKQNVLLLPYVNVGRSWCFVESSYKKV